MNNTLDDVRLLVIGERSKPENRIHYPLNPDYEQTREDAWTDHPAAPLRPPQRQMRVSGAGIGIEERII